VAIYNKTSVGEETDHGYNLKVRAGDGKSGGPVTTLGTEKDICAGTRGVERMKTAMNKTGNNAILRCVRVTIVAVEYSNDYIFFRVQSLFLDFLNPENKGIKLLLNVGNYSPIHTASCPRRLNLLCRKFTTCIRKCFLRE